MSRHIRVFPKKEGNLNAYAFLIAPGQLYRCQQSFACMKVVWRQGSARFVRKTRSELQPGHSLRKGACDCPDCLDYYVFELNCGGY